ncbi:MAG: formate dehydrogenase subunit alpha [Methanobrevibacter smithii]|jgi:formate dehydrogenase alpha subunit|uniref:Formate dehydrogenase, alpha subunit n=4 Tax=Methanobrevibacter smithii TaxID=2173 RepID=D2ZNI6_METSM|nr:formate dehydrogenase subunit alpha [Methanobrevibacter smithii]ATZ58960.1 formate dehydrogenase subunit alpha [Methanobrevibacter smithii]EEE42430.1 formate dehydrogenase, alpha subunit [Methanobrevibacter smithii DSM 2375]EFC94004.1 formate dehydrogenase, alpha subunit [Methanobrevibacter smithii DSM 2374]MBT9658678.1 formate dehydrogenase subunit alpha [Methanobrevibacter smithii]MEE0720466.1 formate dehydrogenase subunit alpha [Methanobrevibacter smithii]
MLLINLYYLNKLFGDYKMVEIKYVPTICPYCGTGCGLNFVVKDDKIVGVEPYKRHPVNEGKVCPKGNFGYEFINREDRLTTPLIKENGEFREASWDEALDLVANKLKEVSDDDPNKVGFYACARSPNENIYITQKLARVACGTQNVDHCARICHGPTVAGLATTFGSGAMTNGFDSIKEADYIFCIGSNNMEAHPLFGRKLIQAQKNGAKLVVLDPRYTPTAKIADEYVQFKTGTDVALMNAMIKVIIDNDLQDDEFIKNRTKGFDELKETVQKYDLETVSEITHIAPEVIEELAIEYAKADKAAIVYSLGITEHSHGADNVMSTANLAMLTGNIGREGTGVNPLRGQNNVQGACDMGALPSDYVGYRKVADQETTDWFNEYYGTNLPAKPGLTLVEMMNAAHAGDLKVLYIHGEDPVLSDADIKHTKEALANLDMLIVQELFMTDTAQCADVVLPAAGWGEQEGTFTNGERRVQCLHKAQEPPEGAMLDWKIMEEIAVRMGVPREKFHYESAEEIFEEIRECAPIFAGMNRERLDTPEALHWPCPSVDDPCQPLMHKDKFAHPDGLGIFQALEHRGPVEVPDEEYPLLLTTTRVLFHYHAAMTRRCKTLDNEVKTGFIEINTEDAKELGILNNEIVKASSRRGEIEIPARVTDDIKKGIVNIPMHFTECAANMLTNSDSFDPKCKMVELKACAIKVEKIEE